MNFSKISWTKLDMNTISPSEADCIHIFKIETESYFKKIQTSYSSQLSDKELFKASRFKQLKDQLNYISRKHFLRILLSEILHIESCEIEYSQIGNKKPQLKGIEFNTTHSGNLAFVAISNLPIGIDSELQKDEFDFESLLKNCFNQAEIDAINIGDRTSNFYSLWTRKEAILKATGEGLIDNLKQVDALQGIIKRKEKEFHVHTLAVDEYILSIACSSSVERIKFWTY